MNQIFTPASFSASACFLIFARFLEIFLRPEILLGFCCYARQRRTDFTRKERLRRAGSVESWNLLTLHVKIQGAQPISE
jgi:hypothetical protein